MTTTAVPADDQVAICASLLAELGHAGAALAAAAACDDVIAAIAASFESRRLRAALARHPLPTDGAGIDVVALEQLVAGGKWAAALADQWRTRVLPAASVLVGSAYGVACMADELLPSTWDVSRDLVVVVGPGLEAVAAMLADLGQARVLAVVDPSASSYPPSATVCADLDEVGHAVRLMFPCAPERVVVRALDGTAADPQQRAIADAVHTALCDLRVHHNTIAAFSETWLAQGAANLDAIARCPSVEAVGDRFAGKPMIICAPGPSLAHNVGQLRAMQGKAIIVGFSHSLRPLRAAGVVPDLVVTVDPQDVRYHFAPGDLDGVAAMVNGVTVHPSLFQLGAARHLSLASNGALDRWLYQGVGGGAEVPGGGSVATTALALGLRWKCDPIVMVGLDLSFPGGKYYVDTSCDGGAHAVVGDDGKVAVAGWSEGFRAMKASGGPGTPRDRVVELPGWHGGMVPSSFMFAMFHRWFVETAKRVAGTVRLYDCTEGGSYKEGMMHVPLAEVLARLEAPVEVARVLDEAMASIDVEARRAAAARWRRSTVSVLRRAGRLAQLGATLATRRDPASTRRLPRVERALSAALAGHDLVAMLAQREIANALDAAGREGDEASYLAASARLLSAAARTTARVCDALTEVDRVG